MPNALGIMSACIGNWAIAWLDNGGIEPPFFDFIVLFMLLLNELNPEIFLFWKDKGYWILLLNEFIELAIEFIKLE